MHGDLMFAGVERVLRIVDQDGDDFSVVILGVTRADTINDPARAMLAGMGRDAQRRRQKTFSSIRTPPSSGRAMASTTPCSAPSMKRWSLRRVVGRRPGVLNRGPCRAALTRSEPRWLAATLNRPRPGKPDARPLAPRNAPQPRIGRVRAATYTVRQHRDRVSQACTASSVPLV